MTLRRPPRSNPLLYTAVVMLLLGCAVTLRLHAQVPSNPSLLSLVQEVQHALSGLTTSMADLTTAVANLTPPAESNVRTTSPMPVATSAGINCAVTNASNAQRQIKIDLMTFGATLVATQTTTLDAGSLTLLQKGNIPGSWYYCRFTVVDGTRTDIRGTGMVLRFDVNPYVEYQVEAE